MLIICYHIIDEWSRTYFVACQNGRALSRRGFGQQSRTLWLVRSMKHTYGGICFFRASSFRQRCRNIISVVERFGRKPLCSSGRIPTRSQYSLRRRAVQQYLADVRYQRDTLVVAALCPPILLFMEYHDDDGNFHCCSTCPPYKYKRRYRAVSVRDHR